MQRLGNVSTIEEAPPIAAHRVHFVGMAGSGVSGLASMFQARGATISGSDKNDSPVLERFRSRGVECWVGHSDQNLSPETDLVLISAAVTQDNPEVRAAVKNQIRVLKYAQCLGYLMGEKRGIAVAGTHGKTTTSAMITYVLLEGGLDPSCVIGGDHPELGGGSRSGQGEFFVAEACEYDRSFLNLRPRAAVVTNIEAEHLDYFKSLEEIQGAFREFIGLLPGDGLLVFNADDPGSRFLREFCPGQTMSFSLEPGPGHWWADRLICHGEGFQFFIVDPSGRRAFVRLRVPGMHNVRNSLACAAICTWAGVPLDEIAEALSRFQPVRRRFDILRREPHVVVDDYAHHPTEVDAVLRAARQAYPGRPIVCVFQPHQFSRLRIMKERFAAVLSGADRVIVVPVYRARDRDEDVRSVRVAELVDAIRRRGGIASFAPDFSRAAHLLNRSLNCRSVVLFLGAGSVTDLAKSFAGRLALQSRRSCVEPLTV
jgi:UDP-N-acetylmuramate--alanine ligase